MFNTQGNLALSNQEEQRALFQFPDVSLSSGFTQEDLQQDTEGVRVWFPRAKIPGGGSTLFELPSEETGKPQYIEKLQGVILYHHPANGYWVGEVNNEDKAPICASVDGKTGVGDPGGACQACVLNRFGSGEDGKSKACKNMRHLYLLRSDEFMPIMLYLPPTSPRPFNDFMNAAFLYRNRASYGSVVEITLRREEKPTPHAVANFRLLQDFTGSDLEKLKAMVVTFHARIKTMLEERVAFMQERASENCDYEGFNMTPIDENGSYILENVGTGKVREELPL